MLSFLEVVDLVQKHLGSRTILFGGLGFFRYPPDVTSAHFFRWLKCLTARPGFASPGFGFGSIWSLQRAHAINSAPKKGTRESGTVPTMRTP